MSVQNHLKRQLVRYKDLLANLSRRNREIYYKESKASTINLSKQPFTKQMFAEGVEMKFSPLRASDETFNDFIKGTEFKITEHFQLDAVRDRAAVTRVINRIDKIRVADDRHQREFGISGAWLLGPFLCWRNSPQASKDELLISPIFKIAIDVKRDKRKKLVLTAEDQMIAFNPSLQLALKQFLGVVIPEGTQFETSKEGIDFLIAQLATAKKTIVIPDEPPEAVPKLYGKVKVVKDEDGNETRVPIKLEEVLAKWEMEIYEKVTTTEFMLLDVLYLDQLNASRMVLYNDYEGIIENALDHPILNELFSGVAIPEGDSVDRAKLRELDAYKERENHFVVDIDSTQHRAIDRATKSKAIVIQGPPGTGKSQTIVNLIADYLAKGKKVLFVSEKRPALDVVFNRMKSANIESQAVLIHSSDLNKSDLYQSFLELANLRPNASDEKERDNSAVGLDRLKSEINQYADILQTQHEVSGLSFADLIVLSTNIRKESFDAGVFKALAKIDFEHLRLLANDLNQIQSLLNEHPSLPSSPWINRHPQTVNSVSLQYELAATLKAISEAIQSEKALKEKYGAIAGCPFDELASWEQSPLPEGINLLYAPLWKNQSGTLKEGLRQLKATLEAEVLTLEASKQSYFAISATATPEIVEELEKYYRLPRGVGNWLSGDFWSYRKIRLEICANWDGGNKQFAGHRLYSQSLLKVEELGKKIFANFSIVPAEHDKNILTLKEHMKILDSLIAVIETSERSLPLKLFTMIVDSAASYNACIELVKEAKLVSGEIKKLQIALNAFAVETGKSISNVSFKNLTDAEIQVSSLIERISELEGIDRFDILISKISNTYALDEFRKIVLEKFVSKTERWSDVLEASALLGWQDEIYSTSTALRSFDRLKAADQVKQLKLGLERHQISSRQAVHHEFAKRWTSTTRNEEALGLLKKEATKQRRILSPREIMEKGALKTMLDLKPCWLMSPLSISQMLPLKSCLFDVIIFDEASQVRVEDAVPSIYRAATMIVVGDPKQMPPTNFFSGGVIEDDDEEEEISPSVLDLAAQVYPSVLLEWHYRSRSEALIAFSNRAYYGGRLIAAPNPQVLTASGALHFVEVKDAYFEGKEGNRVEAEAVIDQLVKLIKQDSKRSYGVIAMGQVQAVALDEALNSKISNDAEARALIETASALKDGEADVGLFIKNLENVQGDERDVILMSVGYAAPAVGKKLRMNFGPLGKQGGGRRLNVAITRAKAEMYVFSSFAPAEMKTDEEAFGNNPDLCVFGRYLKYVESVSNGNLLVAQSILNSFPMGGVMTSRGSSRFALDVKRRIEELGYQVTTEIGSSGFFIDLGIHHPTIQSNFLLGIECDGAVFHSTPYARDRDRIREQLLVSRGWKIERVWSQDWSRDWRKEILRLDTKIKFLLAGVAQTQDVKKASGE